MKPKTMILMVVAVGCGLGASYMTSRLLAERNRPAEEVQTVPVLVAKARVPGWMPIKEPDKAFEVRQFPVDVAPRKALGNLADLKDQRLNKPLDEGKPVTQDDLLTKEQADISSQLLAGQRAVAIKVTAESLVGGFVLPGSRVDVVCTTRGNDPTAKVVLQNMLVLAVDTMDQRNPEQKTILGQTVTVAATPNEAARLSLAQAIGELRLMLKGQGDNKHVSQVVARASDLDRPLPGSEVAQPEPPPIPPPSSAPALPVIPEEEPKPAKVEEPRPVVVEKPKRRHVMTIYNGAQRDKAIFVEGENEDVAGGPGEPPGTRAGEAGDEEAAVSRDEPRAAKAEGAAPPAAPIPATKVNRTKKIQ